MIRWKPPRYIPAGISQIAMLHAFIENQQRDRRRIKRECNKAAKLARAEHRAKKERA